jgi:DNA-binding CsgD family transcriptional regulator
MATSQRLRLADVRGMLRLVGEVREFATDVRAWRTHMALELNRPLDTRVSGAAELRVADLRAGLRRPVGTIAVGFRSERERQEYLAVFTDSTFFTGDPAVAVAGLLHGPWTVARRPPAGDRGDGGDGAGSYLHSQCPIPHLGAVHVITAWRAPADRPVGGRECRLLQLFHSELGRLWDAARDDPRAGLRARVREALDHVVRGGSEKEVAARMGVGVGTVHDYVKQIHRHFGVSTLGELLARLRAADARARFRPRLTLEAEGCDA